MSYINRYKPVTRTEYQGCEVVCDDCGLVGWENEASQVSTPIQLPKGWVTVSVADGSTSISAVESHHCCDCWSKDRARAAEGEQ